MTDWQAIRAEYIAGNGSCRELGEKYGVSPKAVSARATRGNWRRLKLDTDEKALELTLDTIRDGCSRDQIEELTRIGRISDRLLQKLEQAVEELDLDFVVIKEKTDIPKGVRTREFRQANPGGSVDRAGLKQITGALKDIKDIRMIRSALDRMEQELRIQKLREQDAPEVSQITVKLQGGVDGYAT